MGRRLAVVTALALVVVLMSQVTAIRINMKAGETKCLGADINEDGLAVGQFTVISASSAKAPGFQVKVVHLTNMHVCSHLDAFVALGQVKSPSGKLVFAKSDFATGKFAFTAEEDGLHQLCLLNFGASHVSHPCMGGLRCVPI